MLPLPYPEPNDSLPVPKSSKKWIQNEPSALIHISSSSSEDRRDSDFTITEEYSNLIS